MHRQADVSLWQRNADRFAAFFRAFAARQNVYSVMTSLVPGVASVLLLLELLVGQSRTEQEQDLLWLVMFLVLSLLPLGCGSKYTRWGGVLLVVLVNIWVWVLISWGMHSHTEVNALLQVPMLALYVGWFYTARIARLALLANAIVVVLAMWLHGLHEIHDFSFVNAALYALVISFFCLEAASYLRKRTELQARLDPLTGVWNRRGLVIAAEQKMVRARKNGKPFVVAVVDFDDFKRVNDSGGHAAGDEALRMTAHAWAQGLGAEDVVARIGGDEFALLIDGEASEVRKTMREICAATPFAWSWGISNGASGESFDALLSQADTAMYEMKAHKSQ